jgi:DNA-binding response OmpR family regulator
MRSEPLPRRLANTVPDAAVKDFELYSPMVSGFLRTKVDAMRILLIEDNEDDACVIRETLAERTAPAIGLKWVDRLGSGLTRLVHDSFDAVLLDLSLSDSQGLDTFDKVHTQNPKVPIVIMTGLDDEGTAIQAVQRGAQDYLVKKQLDADQLVRALRYAIERHRQIKIIGDILACTECVLNPATHSGTTPLYEKEVQDALTLVKQLESSLNL